MIQISKANINDAPAISAVSQECFSVPMSTAQVETLLNNSMTRAFVARNNSVVGFAIMQNVAGECYIDNIAVLEAYRKNGIGTALTQRLVDTCLEEGCSFITLEVRASNEAAIKMYSSLGFKNEGIRKGFYSKPTEDAIIMTR